MSQVWTFSGAPPALGTGGGVVTLVEGSSFCLATVVGSVLPGSPMGLFVRDTRVLSQWVLEVDGDPLEPLTVLADEPFRATFVTRARPRPRRAESSLLVLCERAVSDGMREVIRIRNLSGEAAGLTLSLRVGADFADLFEVKAGRPSPTDGLRVRVGDDALEMWQEWAEGSRGVRVVPEPGTSGPPPRVAAGQVVWPAVVPARGEWVGALRVEVLVDGRPLVPPPYDALAGESPSAQRSRRWRGTAPVLRTADPALNRTLTRSMEDLGALRIEDPDHPDRVVVAAGAPWFMALFGRDALLASWLALPLDVGLALGTVHALAEAQGTVVDPLTEEQPGRILHERRYGAAAHPVRGGATTYYGSVDSTPLFAMLVGELRRWGLAQSQVDALLPAVDRALDWITDYGDRDGDGFVEYQRATDRGLLHQGWKDSTDAITFADGRPAEPPIALCEVQGYVYAAYLARAHFARESGEEELAAHWVERAGTLRARFNEQFWLPDRGWYAVGLDRDKRPIDALASNMGHCLWTGLIDEDKAPAVVDHLLGSQLFSGWGIRTLGTSMGAYNPMSYHNGTVWPHDNALIVSGLVRYGFTEQARRVAEAVLDAAAAFDGRLPELFCGFDRAEFPQPVPFPTSCSPQAWAAATPVHLLRCLLRFDPWVPFGEVRLAPVVPERYLPLTLENVAVGAGRATLHLGRHGCTVDGLPSGVHLVPEPRRTRTALLPDPPAALPDPPAA